MSLFFIKCKCGKQYKIITCFNYGTIKKIYIGNTCQTLEGFQCINCKRQLNEQIKNFLKGNDLNEKSH